MTKIRSFVFAVLVLFITPVSVFSGDFDGSKQLLCASIKIFECTAGGGCVEVMPGDVNVPQFFRIDLRAKTISVSLPDVDRRAGVGRTAATSGTMPRPRRYWSILWSGTLSGGCGRPERWGRRLRTRCPRTSRLRPPGSSSNSSWRSEFGAGTQDEA